VTEFLQAINYPVRVYTNQIKANWEAVDELPQDNTFNCEIAWRVQWPGLELKIKPLTSKNRKFDSTEVLFDRAANSEVKPDGWNPQQQQPHQQQMLSWESSQQGTKKWNFQPSISEPAKILSLTSQCQESMINAIPCLASRPNSMKLSSRKDNAYTPGHLKIKYSSVQNIHAPTSLETLRRQDTGNKSNTNAPLMVNN